MANISGKLDEKVYRILRWLGLNENPDGDTKLALGEASVIRNFRVTRDGNLQRRPGMDQMVGGMQTDSLSEGEAEAARTDTEICSQLRMHQSAAATAEGFVAPSDDVVTVTFDNWQDYVGYYWVYNKYAVWKLVSLDYDPETDAYTWTMKRVKAVSASADSKVAGLWAGNVKGTECMVAACDGKLWKVHDGTDWCKAEIGTLDTTGQVHMFGYSEQLYIMNGRKYYQWDGTTFGEVAGYRPLVSVSIAGTAGGTTLEQINKLCGQRRVWISPDGSAVTFALPEKALSSVDYVKDRATGNNIPAADYTTNLTSGTVTFATAPTAAVNSYEIGYSVAETDRAKVETMRFSELFNGQNDNRVFLYGDGTNQAIYSGLDYDGEARADYFPDMNVLVIGEANTPITALIRHYSRLLVFKTNSAYAVQYSVETLADGLTTPVYYATPVNRSIGNAAPGQVRLVLNAPYTLHGHELYEWRNASSYTSNLSVDERQAKRISDRITATLDSFDLAACVCWDDNDNQEFYCCYDGRALVHNYASDAWYCYTDFPAACFVNFRGDLYIGDRAGRINSFQYGNRTDNGQAIDSYWESGSIPFDREFMRKYSAMLWVGIKPEAHGEVYVTIQTDRKSSYTEKLVASSLVSFAAADFRAWSFNTNRKPHQKRLKIKAKKFVYYKLIFSTTTADTTVTILNADLRVRYTGYAR